MCSFLLSLLLLLTSSSSSSSSSSWELNSVTLCAGRVQQDYPSFCVTVRLIKRWVSAQLLLGHIPDTVVEKTVVRLFNSPLPFTAPQWVCWLGGCLTSQESATVSQRRICSDNCTLSHTEIEVADQTFYLTQPQYTDTGLTTPWIDPIIIPGAWQGSHWSAKSWPGKPPQCKQESNYGYAALEVDPLINRPTRPGLSWVSEQPHIFCTRYMCCVWTVPKWAIWKLY